MVDAAHDQASALTHIVLARRRAGGARADADLVRSSCRGGSPQHFDPTTAVSAALKAAQQHVGGVEAGQFKEFRARYGSDGTIKMFAYLVLLYDPKPHPLLAIEEPEHQLYPELLHELVEEKCIPRKLKAWREPGARFLILRDNDGADCHRLKQRLSTLCRNAGRPESVVRLACQNSPIGIAR